MLRSAFALTFLFYLTATCLAQPEIAQVCCVVKVECANNPGVTLATVPAPIPTIVSFATTKPLIVQGISHCHRAAAAQDMFIAPFHASLVKIPIQLRIPKRLRNLEF